MGESIQQRFKRMIDDGVLGETEFSELVQAINQKVEIKEGFCLRCGESTTKRRKGSKFCSDPCMDNFNSFGPLRRVAPPNFNGVKNRIREMIKNNEFEEIIEIRDLEEREENIRRIWKQIYKAQYSHMLVVADDDEEKEKIRKCENYDYVMANSSPEERKEIRKRVEDYYLIQQMHPIITKITKLSDNDLVNFIDKLNFQCELVGLKNLVEKIHRRNDVRQIKEILHETALKNAAEISKMEIGEFESWIREKFEDSKKKYSFQEFKHRKQSEKSTFEEIMKALRKKTFLFIKKMTLIKQQRNKLMENQSETSIKKKSISPSPEILEFRRRLKEARFY